MSEQEEEEEERRAQRKKWPFAVSAATGALRRTEPNVGSYMTSFEGRIDSRKVTTAARAQRSLVLVRFS